MKYKRHEIDQSIYHYAPRKTKLITIIVSLWGIKIIIIKYNKEVRNMLLNT